MNCSLLLNGVYLGSHPYGYTEFELDITRHLRLGGKPGQGKARETVAPARRLSNGDIPPASLNRPSGCVAYSDRVLPASKCRLLNRLEVRVESRGDNSRWYSGAGLFRPVKMLLHPPLHAVAVGSVHVTTPQVELLNQKGTQAAATGERGKKGGIGGRGWIRQRGKKIYSLCVGRACPFLSPTGIVPEPPDAEAVKRRSSKSPEVRSLRCFRKTKLLPLPLSPLPPPTPQPSRSAPPPCRLRLSQAQLSRPHSQVSRLDALHQKEKPRHIRRPPPLILF
jgi:hypothetical protein